MDLRRAEAIVGTEELICARDDVPTRLRCVKCEAGICPTCMVRTAVGYKCPTCTGENGQARRRQPLLLALAAVLIALFVGVSLLRSPSRPAPDPVAIEGPGAAADAPPPGRQALIGDEARDGQLSFVVDDFSCAAKPPPTGSSGGPPSQGKLCTLRAHVKNTSNSPATLLGRFQYLVDAGSKTYGADDDLTRAVPENGNRRLAELNINPEVTVPLVLVYDVPETVEPTEARFRGTGRSRFGANVRLERQG